eukprot:7317-Heterococcus_DN1.PRE.4
MKQFVEMYLLTSCISGSWPGLIVHFACDLKPSMLLLPFNALLLHRQTSLAYASSLHSCTAALSAAIVLASQPKQQCSSDCSVYSANTTM